MNTIVNSNRDPVGLFVGDPIEAHREGVAFARKVYATRIHQMVDVAIFNAYPEDTELSSCSSAFNFYWSCRQEIVKPGGIIIVITASSEGFGYHGLSDPGMRLYRRIDEISFRKKLFNEKRLFILSPNINYPDIRKTFPEDTILFKNWDSLLAKLLSVYKDKCSIAVFPCGPLQIYDLH